jgi:hypothetical protein
VRITRCSDASLASEIEALRQPFTPSNHPFPRKFLETFHSDALALLKLKTGGRQNVVVQHVTVTHGGQAVVAGTLTKTGGGSGTDGGGGPK